MIAELDVVALHAPYHGQSFDGDVPVTLPAGTRGTVVSASGDGRCLIVEFLNPDWHWVDDGTPEGDHGGVAWIGVLADLTDAHVALVARYVSPEGRERIAG